MPATQHTQNRLLAAFRKPPADRALGTDDRIRVLQSIAMTPLWLHEACPAIPASRCRAYFRGEPVHPEDDARLTAAAWGAVQAAQKILLEQSLIPGMLTSRRWRLFARRVYDAGAALDAFEKGRGDECR